MTDLAGSTGTSAVGGATTAGVAAGTTAPGATGSATAAGPAGSLSDWLLGAGLSAAEPDGGGTAPEPDGGASLLGRLFSDSGVPLHAHEDTATGGVIDYARLLVSSTAPGAPVSPSDAFWLNPTEVA